LINRLLILVWALVAVCGVGAAFAGHDERQSGSAHQRTARPDVPTVTTMLGVEPAYLSSNMQKAADAGADEIQCEPGAGEALICTEIKGKAALAALRRGETVYGRSVLGMPRGADPKYNSTPQFESDSLVCDESDGVITCVPMSVEAPTAQAGQEVFVYYDNFGKVTFTKRGTPVMYMGQLTIPLHVVAE
jgi:hypothetical protein